LETKSQTKKSLPVNQLSLLEELETDKKPDKIKDKLQNLDINSLTPLEALNTLAEIKNSYL
jgi:DNA mismatch repair ATPase MutS